MKWISVKYGLPEKNCRVLVYSPDYPKDKTMEYRIIDSRFIRICTDVTHWIYLNPPTESP